jgi:hypothetical protein
MKSELKTVYTCDFCKKYSISKGAITRHQKKCSNNPINIVICIGGGSHCTNLEEIEVEGSMGYMIRAFHCKKLDITIYHPKAKIKGLLDKYKETFENQIPMPKDCDFFKDENFC